MDVLEKKKETARRYRKQNAVRLKRNWERYYQKNREKILERSRSWDKEHKERRKQSMKKWFDKNPDKVENNRLQTRYGISNEEYYEMLENQNYCCPICGRHENELTKKLAVDHDHKTNKTRDLLCDKCNQGLGKFNDNIALVLNVIEYLKKHK